MSISAINLKTINPYINHFADDQKSQIMNAIHSHDLDQLKALLYQQKDFSQTMMFSLDDTLQLVLLMGLEDPEFAEDFCLDIFDSSDLDEFDPCLQNFVALIHDFLKKEKGVAKITFQTILLNFKNILENYSLEGAQEILEDQEEISYFEIALMLNDEELVRYSLDQDKNLDLKELDLSAELLGNPFTSKRRKIFEVILSYGYRIEDFLDEDQTIQDVILDAVDDENKNLLIFLNEHGYNTSSYIEELELS